MAGTVPKYPPYFSATNSCLGLLRFSLRWMQKHCHKLNTVNKGIIVYSCSTLWVKFKFLIGFKLMLALKYIKIR